MSSSPYLKNQRLADVIAAIQVMATYKFYKLNFEAWSDRITGDGRNGEHWKNVFLDHPEFFRLDSEKLKVSLVVRRQHPKRFDVDGRQEISTKEFYELRDKSRISRSPLSASEISTLIQTAIDLHSRAIAENEERRWWMPLATAGAGFLGALVGALASL